MFYSQIVGSITDTDENITIDSRNGLPKVFPFYLKLSDGANEEVIQVLSRLGYIIFCKRGQCGSTAQAWADESSIRLMPENFYVAGNNVTFTYDVDSDSTLVESTATGGAGGLDAGNHIDIDVATALADTDLTLSAQAFQKIYIRMSLNIF